ncbi:MAG TPA: ribosome maturation factor RimM [Prolixibacteraceae bacterium]|nr:ribosome maturation factor RimM [Prolixibacteraceae bacterium]
MNPLDIQDFFSIGTIIKPHGLKGDVVIEVEEGFEEVLEESEYLLVEVEGGLVPFFITEEGINFRTPTTLCLAFDDLDTAEKVRRYCGCKIYLHKDENIGQDTANEFSELLGVTVFDKLRGRLGKIVRVDDFSGNVVLTIEYGSHEILIPLSEKLIIQFDEVQQELYLECPEGLIDLYLE